MLQAVTHESFIAFSIFVVTGEESGPELRLLLITADIQGIILYFSVCAGMPDVFSFINLKFGMGATKGTDYFAS
jgi:hypothetical protein